MELTTEQANSLLRLRDSLRRKVEKTEVKLSRLKQELSDVETAIQVVTEQPKRKSLLR